MQIICICLNFCRPAFGYDFHSSLCNGLRQHGCQACAVIEEHLYNRPVQEYGQFMFILFLQRSLFSTGAYKITSYPDFPCQSRRQDESDGAAWPDPKLNFCGAFPDVEKLLALISPSPHRKMQYDHS